MTKLKATLSKMIRFDKHIPLLVLLLLLSGGVNLFAQERAKPKEGEGIELFLKRFNREGTAYRKAFIQLNKDKLGKNNNLRLGVSYTLPPKETASKPSSAPAKPTQANAEKGPHYQKLFGKRLARYDVTSSELKGACFYLVGGHGGPDPGAIGYMNGHQLHEDEYAYDIVLRLARLLLQKGAKVEIVIQDAHDGIRDDKFLKGSKRETCMGSPIPLGQVARLDQRVKMINAMAKDDKSRYKRAVFVHIDSRSKSKRADVFFYYQQDKAASKRFAKTVRETFALKYDRHQPNRGFAGTVEGRNLYVLRHTTPPSLFVELGNIQNAYDQQRIILSNNRQALANWMAEGFVKDYKQNKRQNQQAAKKPAGKGAKK